MMSSIDPRLRRYSIYATSTSAKLTVYASLLRAFSLLSFDTKHMMISQGMTENEQFKLMHVKIDLRRIIGLSWSDQVQTC